MWYPRQYVDENTQEYGNPFNVPIPRLHHQRAVTSSGHYIRLPLNDTLDKAWRGNEIADGMVLSARPDRTLTAGADAHPVQLSPAFFVPKTGDQLGAGRF